MVGKKQYLEVAQAILNISDTLRLLEVDRAMRTPSAYGVVADGLTDDTAAIQAYINGGGSILPGGTTAIEGKDG